MAALDPAVRRLQDGKREAQSLLERGLGDGLALRRRTARLFGTEAEPPQPGNHIALALGGFGWLGRRSPRLNTPRGVLGLASFLAHEARPERALGVVLVVRPAPQPHALHRGCTPARHRIGVVVLEPSARRAAAAGIARERALSPIALPDRALDVSRDVARVGARARASARAGRGRELALR